MLAPDRGIRFRNIPLIPGGLELVEECPFGVRQAPLARDFGVGRYQEVEPVGNRVYPAVERVGEAGAEIRHSPCEHDVGPLEVQDHGMSALEVTGKGLGAGVEALRFHHAHLPR